MTNQVSLTEENDRDAITAIIHNQTVAWNRADAPSFAERYREDVSFTNIAGTRAYGKAGFVDIHATIFRTIFAGSQIRFHIDRIHFLRPDVAIVDIDATLNNVQQLPPGARLGGDGAMHSRLQEVMTKDDGQWSIAAFHNVGVSEASGR